MTPMSWEKLLYIKASEKNRRRLPQTCLRHQEAPHTQDLRGEQLTRFWPSGYWHRLTLK